MVPHLAGHENFAALAGGERGEILSRAGHDADVRHLAVGRVGRGKLDACVAQASTQPIGEVAQAHGLIEHQPPTHAGAANGLGTQLVHVDRGLFVRMEAAECFEHKRQRVLGADHLEPAFGGGLEPARLAHGRLGPGAGEERALALAAERADAVLPDDAGARRGHGVADLIDRRRGQERDDLRFLVVRSSLGRAERAHIAGQLGVLRVEVGVGQRRAEPISNPAGRRVERGVRRVARDLRLGGAEQHALLAGRVGQAFGRRPQRRVVGDDRAHVPLDRLGQHPLGEVDREQHARAQVRVIAAELEANTIPRLGELERCEALHGLDQIGDTHGILPRPVAPVESYGTADAGAGAEATIRPVVTVTIASIESAKTQAATTDTAELRPASARAASIARSHPTQTAMPATKTRSVSARSSRRTTRPAKTPTTGCQSTGTTHHGDPARRAPIDRAGMSKASAKPSTTATPAPAARPIHTDGATTDAHSAPQTHPPSPMIHLDAGLVSTIASAGVVPSNAVMPTSAAPARHAAHRCPWVSCQNAASTPAPSPAATGATVTMTQSPKRVPRVMPRGYSLIAGGR